MLESNKFMIKEKVAFFKSHSKYDIFDFETDVLDREAAFAFAIFIKQRADLERMGAVHPEHFMDE